MRLHHRVAQLVVGKRKKGYIEALLRPIDGLNYRCFNDSVYIRRDEVAAHRARLSNHRAYHHQNNNGN